MVETAPVFFQKYALKIINFKYKCSYCFDINISSKRHYKQSVQYEYLVRI